MARRVIDRVELGVWMVLLDLLVWGLFIAFCVLMVYDARDVGFYDARGILSLLSQSHWHLARDVALVTGCGVYIFIRQFRSALYLLRRIL